MRVLVVGAGAVGCLLGGGLAAGGARVTLLGRAPVMDAIARRGLSIRDSTGAWGSRRVAAFDGLASDPRHLPRSAFDAALVCARTIETAECAEVVAPLLAPGGVAVSCQNGVGTWEVLAQRLGWERVAGSVVSTGMQMPAPGEVEVTVQGFPWRIGLPREFAGHPAPGLGVLAQAAAASPVPFEWSPNIEAAAWRKLVYNNALNALATLRGGSYELLWGDAETAALQDRLMDELWAVGLAHGVQFDPPTLDAMKAWFWPLFERTRCHEPSMLVHLRRGRRTEIDALNGAVSRLGRRHGVPTPENDALCEAIHALERTTLPPHQGPPPDA